MGSIFLFLHRSNSVSRRLGEYKNTSIRMKSRRNEENFYQAFCTGKDFYMPSIERRGLFKGQFLDKVPLSSYNCQKTFARCPQIGLP